MSVVSVVAVSGLAAHGPETLVELNDVANDIGADVDDLAVVIQFEADWKTWARNKRSDASGLLQWLPAYGRKTFGLEPEEIRALDVHQQLAMVREWLRPYRGRIHTLERLYMAVFRPVSISVGLDDVIIDRKIPKQRKAYDDNRELDGNGDGTITKREATSHVRSIMFSARKLPRLTIQSQTEIHGAETDAGAVWVLLKGISLATLFYKYSQYRRRVKRRQK